MLVKSKVLYGGMVAIVAQFTLGSVPAQAFCVELVNFCDRMEVNIDIDGNAYGLWDWDCSGIGLEEMLGTNNSGAAVVVGYLSGVSTTASWVFDVPGRTVNTWLYADGGASAPTPLTVTEPFTVSGASCGFGVPSAAGARPHLPSLISN